MSKDKRAPTGWSAWLIEDAGEVPRYARFDQGGVEWTDDALQACHFVRREDAEQMAYGEDCWAIREHQFGNPGPAADEKLDHVLFIRACLRNKVALAMRPTMHLMVWSEGASSHRTFSTSLDKHGCPILTDESRKGLQRAIGGEMT